MIPNWINDTVRAFGRQMGLKDFVLNDRSAAGFRAENGLALYLEHSEGALMMSVGLTTDDSPTTMKRFLAGVHPSARTGGVRLRAVRVAKSGESRYVVRIPERNLTPTVMESTFRALWQAADYLKGVLA